MLCQIAEGWGKIFVPLLDLQVLSGLEAIEKFKEGNFWEEMSPKLCKFLTQPFL